MDTQIFLLYAGALVVATYLIRLAGVLWGRRLTTGGPGSPDTASDTDPGDSSATVRLWLDRGAVLILVAVAATQTAYDGQDLAGLSRVLGVTVGIIALWRRVPMLLAILLAMATTAALRLLGMG